MVSQVIDSVSFEEFDVDHVAVGPNGVFAVETKYTQSEWWRKRGGGPDVPPEWIERSRSAARKIRLFLGTKGVRTQVRPVLAVWGPSSHRLASGQVGEVTVLVGRDEKSWMRRLPAGAPLDQESVALITHALRTYVVMRKPSQRIDRSPVTSQPAARAV